VPINILQFDKPVVSNARLLVIQMYEKTCCYNGDEFITEEIFTKELPFTTLQNIQNKSFIKMPSL
jgi:hypothetical protein